MSADIDDQARVVRPRRSVLYMPSSNERALEKAKTIPCDALILDLEDAVAPDAKEQARANAVAAGTALRSAAAQFLDVVERNLESFGGDQSARAGEVAKSIAEIDGALGGIADDLAAMEASHAA